MTTMIPIDMQPLNIPSPSDYTSVNDKQRVLADDSDIDATHGTAGGIDDVHSTALTFVVDLVADVEDAKDATHPSDVVALAPEEDEPRSEVTADIISPVIPPAECTPPYSVSESNESFTVPRTPVDVECPPGLDPPPSPSSPSPANTASPINADIDILADGAVHSDATTDVELDDLLHLEPTIFQEDLTLYSLDGVEPLETFIPDTLLPDDLLVHDLHNITGMCDPAHPSIPVRYVRVLPKSPDDTTGARNAYLARDPDKPVRIAHLYLRKMNRLGTGSHSTVYRAPLELRLDPDSQERSRVSVAVKAAGNQCGAHAMLQEEARIYTAFPRRLMEESDGIVDESAVDASDVEDECSDALQPPTATAEPAGERRPASVSMVMRLTHYKEATDGLCRLPPIVPKFFGHYSPLDLVYGGTYFRYHEDCYRDSRCTVKWHTRLLLMEECGEPIDVDEMNLEQWCVHLARAVLFDTYALPHVRSEACYGLFERLHAEGFVQGSAFARNVLTQPGPLSLPREERLSASPSFRIVDFGRGDGVSITSRERREKFEGFCKDELKRARKTLML